MIILTKAPTSRENRFIIIYPAMSSKLKRLPRLSVMRFQGEKRERSKDGIEKKFVTNQMKFLDKCKISPRAVV